MVEEDIPLIINQVRAEEVLRSEAERERRREEVPVEWERLIQGLGESCEEISVRTHIAFVGTALLARATDGRADAAALKVSAGTQGAYSARALAKNVLASLAPELDIHLGVTGREPLNNQPYFRIRRFTFNTVAPLVHARTHPTLRQVERIVSLINQMNPDEARAALRAYIRVRRLAQPEYPTQSEIAVGGDLSDLGNRVRLITQTSEGGKIAQAVVAGLLEQCCPGCEVIAGRVNDPDRRLPGDVGVRRSASNGWERAFEVRDKAVTVQDAILFARKCAQHGVQRAAIVAVGSNQIAQDLTRAERWAEERGVHLQTIVGWDDFIGQVAWWACCPLQDFTDNAWEAVRARLVAVEASPAVVEQWVSELWRQR